MRRSRKSRDHRDEATIDVTSAARPSHGEARFGYPGSCPTCGGSAHLDAIDIRARTMRESCLRCRTEWIVSESECDGAGDSIEIDGVLHHRKDDG
jgi:hypothetical protein